MLLYVGTCNRRGVCIMDLKNLSVFGYAKQNMDYLTARQKVIAGNIANATTPGYLARELEKPNFDNDIKEERLQMTLTNPKHMSGIAENTTQQNLKVYIPRPTSALTIDGNGVILEDQMNEASKTSSEYNRMITLYNKYKTILQLANTKVSG